MKNGNQKRGNPAYAESRNKRGIYMESQNLPDDPLINLFSVELESASIFG
jgi:hypothetical protein